MRLFPTLLLLVPLALAGCNGGAQNRQAKVLFKQHHDTFLAIARQVARCTGNGSMSIFADGSVPDPLIPAHGDTVSCPDTATIAAGLREVKAMRINVEDAPPFGAGGLGASIVLSSRGASNSVHGSAIYYFPQAQTDPFDGAVPLEPIPGRWFFKYFND